jgi:predicted ATP-grasp superfamily ATP-dependent carboligase
VACVGTDDGVAINAGRLMAALAARPLGPDTSILLGSGFEAAPQLASQLAGYGRLYANDPGVVAALKDPELGLALLRACGWPVPATQWEAPVEPAGWLEKEAGAAGGVHVRRAGRRGGGAAAYFQREIPGQPLSVTFLADGDHAYCLGFNRLRVEAIGTAGYCYAGAIAGIDLPADLRAQVQARVDRLVRVTGLRGLAGVDFLLAGDQATALEINPRPTATFELYDDDFRDGLVHWHLASFEHPVPEFGDLTRRSARTRRAIGVVYAQDRVTVPRDAVFPRWCRDLPCGGSVIAAGAPILSVFVEAASSGAAAREVEARSRAAREVVARWSVAERRAVA